MALHVKITRSVSPADREHVTNAHDDDDRGCYFLYTETVIGNCSGNGNHKMAALRALTDAEISRFLAATHVAGGDGRAEQKRRLFCRLLFYTGCLLTEALAVERRHVDLRAKLVAFRTLKTRQKEPTIRTLSIPLPWIEEAVIVADLTNKKGDPCERVWTMGRTTAWRAVKDAMARANISGEIATPIGLRHSFALRQLQGGATLGQVRDFLGNSSYDSMLGFSELLGGVLVQEERV